MQIGRINQFRQIGFASPEEYGMRSTNSLYGKDILDISALTRADIDLIFQTAAVMKKRLKQKNQKELVS